MGNRKKIDNRIRLLIENGVAQGRRSMFVVVGDKARDQVDSVRLSILAVILTGPLSPRSLSSIICCPRLQ